MFVAPPLQFHPLLEAHQKAVGAQENGVLDLVAMAEAAGGTEVEPGAPILQDRDEAGGAAVQGFGRR
jgi:hypothetical protein